VYLWFEISKESNMSHFISLCRTNEKEILFQDLFKPKKHKIICIKCKNESHSKMEDYVFSEDSKFLILRIALSITAHNKSIRYDSKINNFDPDAVVISKTKFKLINANSHLPNDELTPSSGRHYVSWARKINKWLRISDTSCEIYNEFVENLKDIYVLIHEKV
jgi:hypothetical protein